MDSREFCYRCRMRPVPFPHIDTDSSAELALMCADRVHACRQDVLSLLVDTATAWKATPTEQGHPPIEWINHIATFQDMRSDHQVRLWRHTFLMDALRFLEEDRADGLSHMLRRVGLIRMVADLERSSGAALEFLGSSYFVLRTTESVLGLARQVSEAYAAKMAHRDKRVRASAYGARGDFDHWPVNTVQHVLRPHTLLLEDAHAQGARAAEDLREARAALLEAERDAVAPPPTAGSTDGAPPEADNETVGAPSAPARP